MSTNPAKMPRKRRMLIQTALGLAVLVGILLLLHTQMRPEKESEAPILTVETKRISLSSKDSTVLVDVTVSALGDALYPAASMSISFDPSRLELLEIREGNLFTLSEDPETAQALPSWRCQIESCNASGQINIMYLDMTGGKNAFTKELLTSDAENTVLRLAFRLRGSVRTGDILDLAVEDAVFAASNEEESLASASGTLLVRNGKLLIGE